jgi:hypothetical protein
VASPKNPSIEEVLARRSAEWMAVPGVVGTGIGLCGGARCIVVFVVERNAEIERRVPKEADGFPVRIEAGGRVYRRR